MSVSTNEERINLPDGSSHLLRTFSTPKTPSAPVVLLTTAMGVRATYYVEFAEGLAASGVQVVLFDLRGQGESRPEGGRGTTHGFVDIVEMDIPSIYHWTRRRFPGSPVWLAGHSLGGQMALLGAAHSRLELEGVVIIAAGSAWFRARRGLGSVAHLGASVFADLVTRVCRYWPGDVFGFGGRQSAQLMRDCVRQGITGRYTMPAASSDYEEDLMKMSTPVLFYTIDGDAVTPPDASAHLVGKLASGPVTHRQYTPVLKPQSTEPHFCWIRGNPELAEEISGWITTSG